MDHGCSAPSGGTRTTSSGGGRFEIVEDLRDPRFASGPRFWVRAAGSLARRPSLWGTALTQAGRVARPRWWRRPPFLPVPDARYVRFRLETQYGDEGVPEPDDLVVYLRWCRGRD